MITETEIPADLKPLLFDGQLFYGKWGQIYFVSKNRLSYTDMASTPAVAAVNDNIYGRYFLQDIEPAWQRDNILRDLYRYAKPWATDLSGLDSQQVIAELLLLFQQDELRVWQLTDGWVKSAESTGTGPYIPAGSTPAGGGMAPPAAVKKSRAGGHVTAVETAAIGVASHESVSAPPTELNEVQQRQLRYQERTALLQKTAGIPEVQQANERLSFNNDNILRAEAAEYVYKVDEFNRGALNVLPEAPPGLVIVKPEEIGLTQADFTNKQTGFGAALFKSKINGETMLTYRGTNNAVTGKEDWLTNLKQGSGLETEQYNQAMRLARRIQRVSGDDFSIVGHSLGGGLASSGVAVTGQPGYTFNSAGLHPKTASRQNGLSLAETARLITTQAVKGEVLTMAQSLGTKAVIAGATAAIGGPMVGLLAAIGIKAFSALPKASGTMLGLPSVKGGNPVTRHGMDQVVDGIEAQKEEDIKTLNHFSRAYNG